MEADWEFDAGGDAPAMEAHWPGLVDLRREPERAWELAECAQMPALAAALMRLNTAESPVWTSKCDFWPRLEPDAFDRDELDAPAGSAAHAMGCYIDMLPKDDRRWATAATAEAACREACGVLGEIPLRCCRVDLAIRRALLAPELVGLGVTAYLTACGASEAEAAVALQAALGAFAGAVCGGSTLE